MANTRSQTGNKTIKKEEEDSKDNFLILNGVSNTRNNSKITKRKSSKNSNSILPTKEIKEEEDTDTKSLLQPSPKHSPLPKGQHVSQEQINQLIDAIVNNSMSIHKAALTVKLSYMTAHYYYNHYKNDPEKKIPSPRNRFMHPKKYYTQKHIENLVECINKGKMSIREASAKANICVSSARNYYHQYLKNHNMELPVLNSGKRYTQDEIKQFIRYTVDDKMTIKAASKKANINYNTSRKYHREYRKKYNIDPPALKYRQDKIKEIAVYIMDDKMSVRAAAKKANVSVSTGYNYYRKYLMDKKHDAPN